MFPSVQFKPFFIVVAVMACLAVLAGTGTGAEQKEQQQEGPQTLTLGFDACLEEALQNNRLRPVSRYKIAMAEAQHRQALAGYWPQVTATAGYKRMDEAPNFMYPASTISLPAMGLNIPVPAQEIKLMDNEVFQASLEAKWLLYDGGMRKGYGEQATGQVEVMKQQARRTDLEVVNSVKRLYWGAVLAGRLNRVGQDVLARMEATLGLTETMYKEGSGQVKKTDYLSNKVMVETIRSMVALLEKNQKMAGAALANTMGMSWDATVIPADADLPYFAFNQELGDVVSTAYAFSPDWAAMEAGLKIAEGMVRTAKSGHHPRIGFTGKVYKMWSDYDGGLNTDENMEGWTVGLGVELPLFSGRLTEGKIQEARARLNKMKEEKFLLRDGIGLQVRDVFLSLEAAEKSYTAAMEAMKAAEESRDLNTRAYQYGMAKTEDVVSAQLLEAMMLAQYNKAAYEHVALQAQLELVIGKQVMAELR